MSEGTNPLAPSNIPTMYFIGVTTAHSSIMYVFPKWSEILGLGAQIVGYDAPLHAPAEAYRSIVSHIKQDPLAMGALVTTHKIDLLSASYDLFDALDPYAELCGEVSCISKRGQQLEGYAKDPISSGHAWQAIVQSGQWARMGGHVMCIGAGGAAVAISVFVASLADRSDRPAAFIAINRSESGLRRLREVHAKLETDIEFEYILNEDPAVNDALMAQIPPGSMVINATGMGKDRPGSPISDKGIFPEDGLVWELNYRGDLGFLHQARRQAERRNLIIEDGWVYFVRGWSDAISQVFSVDLTSEQYHTLAEAAATVRG